MVFIVNPFGEFPLNDDWSYSKSVETLTNTNQLKFTNWPAMTSVAQVFIGAAWCKIIGFSFTGLRILTLITGLIGIIASYKLIERIFSNKQHACMAAMVIAINPLYFSLSTTFMTDIYFFTFSVLSIWFYIAFFLNETRSSLLLALLFSVVTVLIRQTAILIPLGFFIGTIPYIQLKEFRKPAKMLTLFLVVLLILFIANALIASNNPSYLSLNSILNTFDLGKTAANAFYRIGSIGYTLGLFLLPLTLYFFICHYSKVPMRNNLPALMLTLIFTVPLIREFTFFPNGNVFYNLGIGPKTLKDTYILGTNLSPRLNGFPLLILQTISLLSGILLFYCLFSSLFQKSLTLMQKSIKSSAFALIALFFCAFILPDFFFDRYVLQIAIPVIALLIPGSIQLSTGLARKLYLPVAFIIGLFTTLATHDYLAWNRARASGVNYLIKELNVTSKSIDAGFEWNGWHQTGKINNDASKSWWFVDDDTYLIAFGSVTGYKTKKTFEYNEFLTLTKKQVFVLEKQK
jgi:hypothetical protein